MSGLEIAAAVFSVIQICDFVIRLARGYSSATGAMSIEARKELHLIELEVTHLRGVAESAQSLNLVDAVQQLWNESVKILEQLQSELQPPVVPCQKGGLEKLNFAFKAMAWSRKRPQVHRLLRSVRDIREHISFALHHDNRIDMNAVKGDIHKLQSDLSQVCETFKLQSQSDLLHWISPLGIPYWAAYEKAQSLIWGDTGEWLAKTREYERWRSNKGLFCMQGASGTGKTVLSSGLIGYLFEEASSAEVGEKEKKKLILYFFFDYRDAARNTTTALYDSLMAQLLEHHNLSAYDSAGSWYDGVVKVARDPKKLRHGQLTPQSRLGLLRDLLRSAALSASVYLVIDGCDECVNFTNADNICLFQSLSAWARGDKMPLPGASCTSVGDCKDWTLSDDGVENEPGDLWVFLSSKHLPKELTTISFNLTLLDSSDETSKSHLKEEVETYVTGRILAMGRTALASTGSKQSTEVAVRGDLELTSLGRDVVTKIVEISDGYWIHAHNLVERFTKLRCTSDVQMALDVKNIPRTPFKHYQKRLEDLIERHPDLANRRQALSRYEIPLLGRMIIILCQATYCMPVAQFAALCTLRRTNNNELDKDGIPWDPEGFVQLLGDFQQHTAHPDEVNIPHAPMESYLQRYILGRNHARWRQVADLTSQRYMAEICAWFLGCTNFKKPLSRDDAATGESLVRPKKVSENDENPFRKIPGGLGRPLNTDHPEVEAMLKRLNEDFPGLEYVAINFPFHARRVAYLEYKHVTKSRSNWDDSWVMQRLHGLVETWLLPDARSNRPVDDQYRSWLEVHAFFCCELPEVCHCRHFPERSDFLKELRLQFLLGPKPASSCLWCWRSLGEGSDANGGTNSDVDDCIDDGLNESDDRTDPLDAKLGRHILGEVVGDMGLDEGISDDEILCRKCQEENKRFSGPRGQGAKCGRTFRFYQGPDLLYSALQEGQDFLLSHRNH